MGNVVMPKNSADLDVLIPILQYYYNKNTWVSNAEYIEYIKNYLLKKGIDDREREPQHYTKRMQVLSYFGFIEFEDYANSQSNRRITPLGKKFYEAISTENQAEIIKILLESLEKTVFGRKNCGAPSSDSDVDAPILCIRAILDLDHINKTEFAYLLYQLQDRGFTYSTIISEIKDSRNGILQPIQLPEDAQKYTDWKPINFLERFKFLETENSETTINDIVLKQHKNQLLNLKIFNIDKNIISEKSKMPETKPFENFDYKVFDNNEEKRYNRIVFGAPGTGKSHLINGDKDNLKALDVFERVTFHPNYSYSQFVGTYKPVTKNNGDIVYKYVAGPFMRLLTVALENAKDKNKDKRKRYLLIIEEINRANVASVFGDIFQLLDRDKNGVSEYEIQTSEDVRKFLANTLGGDGSEEKYKSLKLPNNMYIWATMNSADQGVFPMDTAFKRRWEFEYIGINENEKEVKKYSIPICKDGKISQNVNWNDLRKAINNKLITLGINEDKLLGPFFLSKTVLDSALDKGMDFVKLFESKVLMYLFEDAAKMKAKQLFNVDERKFIYSEVCKEFELEGLKVFKFNEEDVVEEHDIAIKKDDAPSDGKLF